MASELGPCPPRFVELKKEIAGSYPDFEARVTKAWGEILQELEKVTKEITGKGSQVSEPSPASRHLCLAGLWAHLLAERTRSELFGVGQS